MFKVDDVVWIKGMCPPSKFDKLKPKASGPFKLLKQISQDANEIKLPKDYGIPSTFNVANLSIYYRTHEGLGTSSFQPLEIDIIVSVSPHSNHDLLFNICFGMS